MLSHVNLIAPNNSEISHSNSEISRRVKYQNNFIASNRSLPLALQINAKILCLWFIDMKYQPHFTCSKTKNRHTVEWRLGTRNTAYSQSVHAGHSGTGVNYLLAHAGHTCRRKVYRATADFFQLHITVSHGKKLVNNFFACFITCTTCV